MNFRLRWAAMTRLHRSVFVASLLASFCVIANAVVGFVSVFDDAAEHLSIRTNLVLGPIMILLVCWNMLLVHRSRAHKNQG